jgi:hypothetical protein
MDVDHAAAKDTFLTSALEAVTLRGTPTEPLCVLLPILSIIFTMEASFARLCGWCCRPLLELTNITRALM